MSHKVAIVTKYTAYFPKEHLNVSPQRHIFERLILRYKNNLQRTGDARLFILY